jgi:hypothetical protein
MVKGGRKLVIKKDISVSKVGEIEELPLDTQRIVLVEYLNSIKSWKDLKKSKIEEFANQLLYVACTPDVGISSNSLEFLRGTTLYDAIQEEVDFI